MMIDNNHDRRLWLIVAFVAVVALALMALAAGMRLG